MTPFIVKNEDVNRKIQIQPIFPKPLGILQMDKAVSKKILEFSISKEIELTKNIGGNSISKNVYILDNDELSDIKKVLTDSVNQYFKEIINPDQDMKLYITNSWINANKNGETHHPHKHPNSIVSAVFYIDTCEEDTLSFMNKNNEIFGNFSFGSTHPTSWLADDWKIHAKTDTLIMFPSSLPHYVNPRPNTCTGTRVSLSFNTWFKGTIGDGEDSPTQLHL
jgi:uncharacterized protein (TIGR02466 family)